MSLFFQWTLTLGSTYFPRSALLRIATPSWGTVSIRDACYADNVFSQVRTNTVVIFTVIKLAILCGLKAHFKVAFAVPCTLRSFATYVSLHFDHKICPSSILFLKIFFSSWQTISKCSRKPIVRANSFTAPGGSIRRLSRVSRPRRPFSRRRRLHYWRRTGESGSCESGTEGNVCLMKRFAYKSQNI